MLLEEAANLKRIPTKNVLHDRNEDAERVLTKNGPFRYLGEIAILRHGDGKAVQSVDVQHHVNIGAPVADIDQMIVAYRGLPSEMIEDRDLAVSRSKRSYSRHSSLFVER